MDYRGARFYDSEVGRFLSLDPLAREFPSMSDYNYVLGNPISFIDPTGKAPTDDKDIPSNPNRKKGINELKTSQSSTAQARQESTSSSTGESSSSSNSARSNEDVKKIEARSPTKLFGTQTEAGVSSPYPIIDAPTGDKVSIGTFDGHVTDNSGVLANYVTRITQDGLTNVGFSANGPGTSLSLGLDVRNYGIYGGSSVGIPGTDTKIGQRFTYSANNGVGVGFSIKHKDVLKARSVNVRYGAGAAAAAALILAPEAIPFVLPALGTL